MFHWLKVLNRLSREDNILEKMDNRYSALAQKMQETEQKLKEAQGLYGKAEELASGLKKEIDEGKAFIEKVEAGMETCDKQIQDKLLEIKNSANKYLDEVNAKVQSYDSNISAITGKLKELHEAVAEFQR